MSITTNQLTILPQPSAEPISTDASRRRRNSRRVFTTLSVTLVALGAFFPQAMGREPGPPRLDRPITKVLKPVEKSAVLGATGLDQRKGSWHPPHKVKAWTTRHKSRTFRVIQLPHCEHIETLITYNPAGETVRRAKLKSNGIAACTGSFHNPSSMALADFLQRNGSVLSPARTGRGFFAVHADRRLEISKDYHLIKGKTGVSALALGQRLLPLERDGFSVGFMNRVTDRMAIGLNKNFIFIVQGKSDIWRLSHFMQHKLPITTAINCDGGHVVKGKGPVHIVFRWATDSLEETIIAQSSRKSGKGGGT